MKKKVNLKNKVAFQSSNDRSSGGLGLHPGLDPAGAKKSYDLGPGQYEVKDVSCSYKKFFKESWKTKLAIEEWSKNIGYNHPHVLEERRHLASLRGPGSYDVNENIFKKQSSNMEENNLFGKQRRFYNSSENNNPPPGTYTGEWINKPIITHKQMTKTPPFEWDGLIDRFRGQSKPWMKPPNIYRPKDDGCVEALINKVVSLRGPYDLFTGPRDGTTIKNHFSPNMDPTPEEYFRYFPSELEYLLTSSSKERYGKFYKAKRWGIKPIQRNMLDDPTLCYRDPNDPGPAHYDVLKERSSKQNMYAFNQSIKEAKPSIKWKILPGVGRYNPKLPRCTLLPHGSWVFMSKIGRPVFKAPEYNSF